MKTKNQIQNLLQELDELHEFTAAQQKEYDALETALDELGYEE